ncbi:MAG: hypothetical protein HYX47_10390 [Burkholderiales bacterium]|nr:hypothetical protein [Burkholderiales bacterium]
MSLDVLLAHNELRQATAALVEKSLSLGSLATRYIALFRPAKNRMSPDRWAKLIMQLLPDVQRNAITHKGREWHMPLESWKLGLEAMLEKAAAGKLTLPLDSHAYLYTVLAGMADKVEAAAESQTETQRRTVHPAAPQPGRTNVDQGFMTVEAVQAAIRARQEAA